MEQSKTADLLKGKILKILTLLLLIRFGLYVPVPGVDLNIFDQGQALSSMFSFAKSLVGNSFLSIGSIGILPYINASIILQLLIPLFPNLERLQKEEGELGRQQIRKYTRYLTVAWALILSTALVIFGVKPLIFDWTFFRGLEIILALTTGSVLSMWFAELITEEGLGNGSSMIIFINIIGGIPNSLSNISNKISVNASFSSNITLFLESFLIYLFIVTIIIIFQDSYKKIYIISAKQLNVSSDSLEKPEQLSQITNSFIPLKLNQGGIMPLVFSSTISILLVYPVQLLIAFFQPSNIIFSSKTSFLTFFSFGLNLILIIFFSCFYASLVLKPKDMSESLNKMAYTISSVRQGKETTKYLEKIIYRLAFVGGLFLAFIAFFPILLGNIFQFNLFTNFTSLLILIGVITDTTSQIQGYLTSARYENIKKA
jgi:preprotein translocase subunit SecY